MFLSKIIKMSYYYFFFLVFLVFSGNTPVCGETLGQDISKEIIITQKDFGGEKQSCSSIEIILDTQKGCHVKNIQSIELHTPDGVIYQFDSTEFYETPSGDYCLINLPFLLPDLNIILKIITNGGEKYEFSVEKFQDNTRKNSRSTNYNGDWAGTTNQGFSTAFTITNNKVTFFSIKYKLRGLYCSVTTTKSVFGSTPIIGKNFVISGRDFNSSSMKYDDYRYAGTFSDSKTCAGKWSAENSHCVAYGSGTWSADKDEKPAIDVSPTSFNDLSIVDSFDTPGPWAKGLTFDGTYLWHADNKNDKIYKLDTSGNIIDSFDSPGGDPYGLAYDGTHLWNVDAGDDKIYKLDTSGNIIDSFDSPKDYPFGLTYDGAYLWHADYGTEKIYKLDTSGNIIDSFDSPDESPYGLAYDGTHLWNADTKNDKIYKLDTSGDILTSFNSPGSSPEGLTYDGTYLWNADAGDDKIYKFAPPEPLMLGLKSLKTFTITNSGSANLEIYSILINGTNSSEFTIQNSHCTDKTIAPLGDCKFDVVFSPASEGGKTASLEIQSNDPKTPTFTLPLSGSSSSSTCPPNDGDVAPLGNRDGQVNVGDALVSLRFALGMETPTQEDMCHGDVAPLDINNQPSRDGQISVGDSLVILRKALEIISF